jgi:hypothetical protein
MFGPTPWSSTFVPTQRRRNPSGADDRLWHCLSHPHAPVRSHLATSGPPSRASVGSRVASDSRVGRLTSGDIPALNLILGGWWRGVCWRSRQETACLQALSRSPLTNSNRRPHPYHSAPRREPWASPGHGDHEHLANQRNQSRKSDRGWPRVPALVLPQCSVPGALLAYPSGGDGAGGG